MELFSVDGKLFQFLRRLTDMLKINVLWLICSIPIVTIGASTTALFDVTMRMIDETEGYVARQFLQAFKKNLKNGIPLGILFLAGLYALWMSFQLAMIPDLHPFLFLTMFILFVVVFVACFIYAFALSARYENTLIHTVKNSYDIFIRHIVRNGALVLVLLVEFAIFFWSKTTIFFFILLGPACIALTISGWAVPIFREIEQEDGAVIRKEGEKDENQVFEDHPDTDKGISKRAHMNMK
jgi:uncharacterized membrane protein YesL